MKTLGKVLCIVAGILFIGIGGYMIFHPGITLVTLSLILGISTLVYGIFAIVSYAAHKKDGTASGLLLFDGIVSVIFGCLLFSHYFFAFFTFLISYMFSFWILLRGVSVFINSLELKKIRGSQWGWLCALGVITIIFGMFTIFEPLLTALLISIILGTCLIFYGIMAIVQPFIMEE